MLKWLKVFQPVSYFETLIWRVVLLLLNCLELVEALPTFCRCRLKIPVVLLWELMRPMQTKVLHWALDWSSTKALQV